MSDDEAGAAVTEIAGMPVKTEPRGLMAPLSAVAIIKGLNEAGEVNYWRVRTADVTTVDAVGMHEVAAELCKRELK